MMVYKKVIDLCDGDSCNNEHDFTIATEKNTLNFCRKCFFKVVTKINEVFQDEKSCFTCSNYISGSCNEDMFDLTDEINEKTYSCVKWEY